MNDNKVFKYTVISVISFWLLLFVLLPNVMVFIVSLLTRDEAELISFKLTFANYFRIADPVYFQVLKNSLYMAGVTTLICVIVAFPFSYIISRLNKNLKNITLLLIVVPFWTSALIRTYAIKIILTTNGLLNNILIKLGLIESPIDMLYTKGAVIIGLVYTLLPFMILPIFSVIDKLDKRYIEAAHDLGANKFNTFIKIIIPITSPGIIAGSLLVFLPALGLFYIPDILGGAKTMLIGNLIKNQFLDARNWPFGAALSSSLTLIMALLLFANFKTIKNMSKKGVL